MAGIVTTPLLTLNGPVEVVITPATAETGTWTHYVTTGAFAIPANTKEIRIYNMGITDTVDADVDGDMLPVGGKFLQEAKYDPSTNTYRRLPAVAGDGNGSTVEVQYFT